MPHVARLVLALAPVALATSFACGGAAPLAGKDRLAKQANIRASCDAAERGHDDPFTVEWDATDVASFETQAQRDTVFVAYHGCDLQVLASCNDPKLPGKLGGYGSPTITSGGERTLEIKNEGELYASLPLGAAKLGGRVSAGESLRLRYVVAGVATDSRSALYRDELAAYAGCAGATHFVAAYNIGAFVVETMQTESGGVSAGVAGGSTSRSEQGLGASGRIDSCATAAKDRCRVPIRLRLRRIAEGAPPAQTTAVDPSSQAAPSSLEELAAWSQRIETIKAEARKKISAGDAKACLAALDVDLGFKAHEAARLATQASMAMIYEGQFLRLKAECQASAGDCKTASATMRDALRLDAMGNDIQFPGRGLKDQAERMIDGGGAEEILKPWCAKK